MPRNVDERVVRMKFDNAQFEQGVKGTMSLLEKFEQSLHLKGASAGLKELSKAATDADLSPLEKATENITVKFNAMSVAAITAIQNIVDKAVDAGIKITKSLTVDQLMSGFTKYTDKTNAVQTIMNATGKSVDDVSVALQKLQWFSDETSYSFVDMTSNVGKFTSAGIDLDVAVSAMQGIANAAADAGANSNEASRAMYNFAQALSKGYVQLIDWKSIENANMSTLTFKQTMIDAAEAAGTLKRVGDGLYETLNGNEVSATNFNENLKDAWLTNDVLLSALGKYSEYSDKIYEISDAFDTCADAMASTSSEGMELGARAFKAAQQAKTFTDAVNATKDAVSSGWMQTFEIIFGDFNESVELWTGFTNALWDIFASGAEGRNELLEGGLMSGWKQFMNTGITDSDRLKQALIDVYDSTHFGFDKVNIDLDNFEDTLSSGWLTSWRLADGIDNIVKEINTLSDEELKARGYTDASIESFKNLKEQIDDGTISLDEFAELMSRPSGRENLITGIANSFHALESVISPIREAISNIFPAPTVEQIYKFTENFAEFTSKLQLSETAMSGLQKITSVVLKPIKELFNLLKTGGGYIGKFVLSMHDMTDGFLTWVDSITSVKDVLKVVFTDDQVSRLMTSWSTITEKLSKAFDKLKTAILNAFGIKGKDDILARVDDSVGKLQDSLKKLKDSILEGVVKAFEKLADLDYEKAVDNIISGFTNLSNYFDTFRENVALIFGNVKDTVSDALDSIQLGDFGTLKDAVEEAASGIQSFFSSFSLGDAWDRFQEKYPTIVSGLNSLSNAISDFVGRLTPAKVIVIAFGAVMIAIMTNIASFISSVTKAVDMVTKLITNVTDILGSVKKSFKSAIQALDSSKWVMIAGAIFILAAALKQLSEIDPSRLWGAVGALGALAGGFTVLMGVFTGVSMIISKSADMQKGFNSAIVAAIAIAGSIYLLAEALKKLSGIDTSSLGESALAVIAMFVGIAGSLRILATDKQIGLGIGSALGIALSLVTVIGAIKYLSTMSPGDIEVGLSNLQAALLALFEVAMIAKLFPKSNSSSSLSIGKNGLASNKSGGGGSFSGVIGTIVAMLAVIWALKKLSEESSSDMMSGLENFQYIFAALLELSISARIAGNKSSTKAMIGMAAMILAMQYVVGKLGEMPLDVLQQGTKYVTLLSGVLAGLTWLMKSADKDKRVIGGAGGTLLKMSIAMLALSVVIEYLGGMSTETLVKGTAVITALGLVMSAILAVSKDAGKVTGQLIAMGVVIGLATAAIGLLSLLKWDELLPAAISLGTVLLTLAAVVSSVKGLKVGAAITAVVTMGLVLTEVVAALSILTSFKNPEAVIASGLGLGIALIAVAGAFRILEGGEFADKKLARLIPTAIMLSVFLIEITGALSALTAIGGSWDQMIAAAGAISLTILAVAEAMNIMTKNKIGDSKTARLVAAAQMMAAFIIEITAALAILGNFGGDPLSMITAAGSLSLTILAVSEAINIMSDAKLTKAKVDNLIKMAGSMALFLTEVTAALAVLGNFGGDPANMLASAVSLSLAINAVALAINIMDSANFDNAKIGKLMTSVLAIGTLLAVLTTAFIALTEFNAEDTVANAVALGLAINAVALATNMLNGMDPKAGLGVALAIVPMILSLTAALAVMGQFDATSNLENLAGLTLVIVALAGVVAAADALNMGTDTIGSAAALGASIDAIILIVGGLTALAGALLGDSTILDQGVEQIKKLEDLLPIFGILAAVAVAADKLNVGVGAIGSSASLAASIDVIIGIIGALATGIGALVTEYPDIESWIDKGFAVIEKISNGLGSIIGGFAGGIAEGFTDSLKAIGENFAAFNDSIGPFMETLGSENAAAAGTNISNLAEALLKVTGSDVLGKLTGSKSSLGKFGEDLEKFAEPFSNFISTVGAVDVDAAKVETISMCASALAEFANNLPTEGGWLNKITGQNQSLKDFADGLAEFAPSFADFLDTMSTVSITQEQIDTTTKAMTALSDFANSLKREGGWWQDVAGEVQSVQDFMNDVMGYGSDSGHSLPQMLKEFASEIGDGFDAAPIQGAVDAAQYIANFAEGLKREGGWWQSVTGDIQSIQSFMSDVMGYGIYGSHSLPSMLKDFASELGTDFRVVNIQNAAIAAGYLSDFAKGLGKEGGVLSWATGSSKSIQSFVQDIAGDGTAANPGLARALADFSKVMSDSEFSVDNVSNAVAAAEKLSDLAKALGNNQTLWEKIGQGSEIKLSDFGKEIEKLSASLKIFGTDMANINMDQLTSAVGQLEAIQDIFTNVAAFDTEAVSKWISSIQHVAKDTMQAFIDQFSYVDSVTLIQDAAVRFIDTFINNAETTITERIGTVADSLRDAVLAAFVSPSNNGGATITLGAALAQSINQGLNDISIDTSKFNLDRIAQDINKGINNALSKLKVDAPDIFRTFVTEFTNSAQSQSARITSVVQNTFMVAESAARKGLGLDTIPSMPANMAKSLIDGFTVGVTNSQEALSNSLKSAVSTGVTAMVNEINTQAPTVQSSAEVLGTAIPTGVSNSILSSYTLISGPLQTLCTDIYNALDLAIKSKDWTIMGKYVAQGLADGIRNNAYIAISAAQAMASQVEAATKSALQENSPSRLSYQFGEYWDQGLANGINESTSSTVAAENMAKRAITALSDSVYNSNFDTSAGQTLGDKLSNAIAEATYNIENSSLGTPTIRPILDLTNVTEGLRGLDLGDSAVNVSAVATNFKTAQGFRTNNQNDISKSSAQPTNITFNQTNTSPKALNPSEVYRNTKNLLSQLRTK